MYFYKKVPFYIISFLGTTSNVLLIVTFIKDPLKCFRNSATYLVMNLSISDLWTCIFFTFAMEGIVHSGMSFFFFSTCCANASFVSIATISIDRFLMVVYPFRHRQWMKGKPMLLWLTGIWLAAFILPILHLLFGEPDQKYAINYLRLFLVSLSLIMYAITYASFKKHLTSISQQNSTERRAQEIRIIKEKRFLKTIFLIASIAFICTVPSLIYFLIKRSRDQAQNFVVSDIVTQASALFFIVNFAINPFIYILRLPNYRKTFHVVYSKKLQTIFYGCRNMSEIDTSNV